MLADIERLFERDMNRLVKEIQSYKTESDIWITSEGISNSGGNLVLHLVGNLNHFFGTTLAHTGYVRDRDREFSDKNVPRQKLISDVEATMPIIKTALHNLSKDDLEKDFPVALNNVVSSNQFMLIHLYSHLNYHLGQINYHRRLIDKIA